MNAYIKATFKSFLALGLFHLGATLFVRSSNLFLLAKARAIAAAGYLALPNPSTRPSPDSWEAALCGALFFTLTSGALALFTAHAAPLAYRLGLLPRSVARGLHALLLVVFSLFLGITRETIPLLLGTTGVYLVLLPTGAPTQRVRRIAPVLFHALIPVFLALCIAGTHQVLPRGLFSGFRDAFLFDNPAGDGVRHFYYTYTLFPAEAFKRLDQKSQPAVNATGPAAPSVTKALTRMGHLAVPQGPVDYSLSPLPDRVTLSTGKTGYTVSAQEFCTRPNAVFQRFSKMADPFGPLRALTWYALLTGFPLLFYLLFHVTGTLLAGLFCPLPLAARISTVGVAASAAFFILLLASGHALPHPTKAALAALSGARGKDATEVITRAGSDKSALVRYRAALAAPRIPHPGVREELLVQLSRDPDTNVVCQALGAMGETRDRRYLRAVEEAVRTRPEWYVQWYGYRAMRRLGWQPTPR